MPPVPENDICEETLLEQLEEWINTTREGIISKNIIRHDKVLSEQSEPIRMAFNIFSALGSPLKTTLYYYVNDATPEDCEEWEFLAYYKANPNRIDEIVNLSNYDTICEQLDEESDWDGERCCCDECDDFWFGSTTQNHCPNCPCACGEEHEAQDDNNDNNSTDSECDDPSE